MSKFSINDKVSFINEKQDGIVKSIKPGGICVVEIEDGFEIDALESELVLIRQNKNSPVPVSAPKQKQEEEKVIPVFLDHIPLDKGVWLISSPAVSGQVLTGPVDLYIVNNSDYNVLAAVSFQHKGKTKGTLADKVEAGMQLYISTCKREEIFDIDSLYVQLLFHKNGNFNTKPSVTKEIPFLLPDLTSANNKLETPYAFCKSILISGIGEPTAEQTAALFNKYSSKEIIENIHKKNTQPLPRKTTGFASELEVDLHIEELIDDFSGMSNAEIISLQIAHFRKKLDEAIYKKAWKIIFIHGAGNGRLKASIRNELKELNLKFTDGAYEKYGGGATEIIL